MLKIRLRRMGNRNRPFYRVVVSDSRRAPSSTALEELGHYHPSGALKGARIDVERVNHWVERGARLSPTVRRLVRRQLAEPEAAPAPEAAAAAAADVPEPAAAPEPEAAPVTAEGSGEAPEAGAEAASEEE